MRRFALLGVCLLLTACSGGEHEDLRQWMADETKDIRGRIPPLPEVKPYEPVPYDAGNLLDPFRAAKIEPEHRKSGGGGMQPDFNRHKEPLESFPLESLKYVGVLLKAKASYAIILADGALHQVKLGNYMGQNFGVITKISESEVALRELIQDPGGEWVERVSTLQLQEKETGK